MKILLVNKAYPPHLGGVETVVRQLARGMRASHDVAVLCFGERECVENLEGVRVHRVRPLFRVGSAPLGWSYLTAYRRLAAWADVVHFQSPNPMGELVRVLCPSKQKTVATYHGDAVRPRWLLPFYDLLMRFFLRRCDGVAVTNPNVLQTSRVLAKSKFPLKIVPIGVDPARFVPGEAGEARRLARRLKGFKLMFSGRLVYYKGVEVLLEALGHLKADGLEVSVLIVGEGPRKEALEAWVEKNGLSENVTLLPPQPEDVYTALFREVDCFVLPSLFPVEAFGIVLLEAMASGLPVVSTELGTGTSWVNRDGETGLVVCPGDAPALARAVAFLAAHPKERQRMGRNAAARVEDCFTEAAMLRAYEALYLESGPA